MNRTTPASIAFLHIPKTAGLAIAHAFTTALGAEACAILNPTISDDDFVGKRFVSGHCVLSTVTPNAWRFTFLRNPVHQLASHLRWLDRYNDPRFQEEALPFSAAMRNLIARVGATDFASARSLQDLFECLPPDPEACLVNLQSDVLARPLEGANYPTPAQLAEAAIANLARLQFVGVVERIERDLRLLFRKLGIDPAPSLERRNVVSSNRRIDTKDPAIRQVLARHVDADLVLYAHVRRRRRRAVLPWARDR